MPEAVLYLAPNGFLLVKFEMANFTAKWLASQEEGVIGRKLPVTFLH